MVVVAVYTSLDTKSKNALQELFFFSIQMKKQPDGMLLIVAVHFIQTDPRAVLAIFHKYVYISNRGKIPWIYTKNPCSYKALPRSCFGLSNHISLLFLSIYSQPKKGSNQL